jgi:hypothetical protein
VSQRGNDELVLHRGVGNPTTCKSCGAAIVFAYHFTTGRNAPFEKDDAGHFILENGAAKHVGAPAAQLALGTVAEPEPQRYAPHFSRCPQASQWRKK